MPASISVLLVDDHAMVRRGCRQLLEENEITVAQEATSGEDACRLATQTPESVVVLDLTMDGMTGLEVIRRLRSRVVNVPIVVFTMHDDVVFAARTMQAGAMAYVTKTSPPQSLVEAVRCAAAGNAYLSHDIAQALAVSNQQPDKDPLAALTKREFEIFCLLVEGSTPAQIAKSLSITSKSVSNCFVRIKSKLGVQSVAELVRIAIARGLQKA